MYMFSGNFPLSLQQKLEIQLNIFKHLRTKGHQLSQAQNNTRCLTHQDAKLWKTEFQGNCFLCL